MTKQLPYSLKILREISQTPNKNHLFDEWLSTGGHYHPEIVYLPGRVLMQDFTGVPAVVDLAAMRDSVEKSGLSPELINPQIPVDLVIDHSVSVDQYGNELAFSENVALEVERNFERYEFLKWSQHAFKGLRVVPPGTGICHQVNIEYLAQVVCEKDGAPYLDTLVGTDSHTTMVNGLGVLGWGVGGIEAEASMLGQPIAMRLPEVIGVHLMGRLQEGITATDMVLTITDMLRQKGVVGKFVEFYGEGVKNLTLAERATIANMAPEYGATCGMFPVDDETLNYLRLTGRSEEHIERVKSYLVAMDMWDMAVAQDVVYSDIVTLDLSSVVPCMSGPKRPQDRVELSSIKGEMQKLIDDKPLPEQASLRHGDVIIAAITSCTNTSNPSVLVAAGLVARKAREKGLSVPNWVKTSLAPGSKVVTAYLDELGLTEDLNALGFFNVGYGCTTCIGNSGPLNESIRNEIAQTGVVTASVLSGNRNFEGRVHPLSDANWLASPPLVVAFALAGTTLIDMASDPIGKDSNGQPVYLKDIWPTQAEISEQVRTVRRELFTREYADVFSGGEEWQNIAVTDTGSYAWKDDSSYIRCPNFFEEKDGVIHDINDARILAVLGDSVTTDHISPAGVIKADSPAGNYLQSLGIDPKDFNSYGSRRGNFEVMTRGTFANIRIRNKMLDGIEGGFSKHYPSEEILPIYDLAMKYKEENRSLVVFAGKEYGTGSSRDWAAKGTLLLGVRAVVAQSFERIHRSNLIGMGVLPLEFTDGDSPESLGLSGSEVINITGLESMVGTGHKVKLVITKCDGQRTERTLLVRIDTENELQYFKSGGILNYVLARMKSA